MRLNILIDKNGVILNPEENSFINASSVDGDASYSLINNQVSIECMNGIKTLSNGKKIPDYDTEVNTGLSGTLNISVYPSNHSPYAIPIQFNGGIINISAGGTSYLQWTGLTQSLKIVAAGITGCNYINLLIDRT
jgi:hypothetical protein